MQIKLRLLLFFALLLYGCSTKPTSTPEAMPVSTDTAEPTLSVTAATSAPDQPAEPTHLPNAIPTDQLATSVFHFYEGNPILQKSNNPKWDNLYIDPGATIYHDGMFHMFFNGINGFPAPVGVGYATSPDGYHWTRQTGEPVLHADQLRATKLHGTNFFVSSALVESDGSWILYFYTLTGGTFIGLGEIGRATAPAPAGPWTIDPDPVLSPGLSGSWDDIQVSSPEVIKTENGYLMYYDGLGKISTSMIGMAISSDGLHWQKHNAPATTDPSFLESDPVLKGSDAGWDSKRVIDPSVVQTPDGLVMIYLATSGSKKFAPGQFAFGAATSPDGVSWTKSALNPILSNKDHLHWSQAFLTSLVYVDQTYFLYFDFVTSTVSGTNVYLATYDGALK